MRGLVGLVVVAGLAGGGRAAEPYRNAAHRFALDVPDGWEALPPRDLAAYAANNGRRDRMPTVAGFRPAGTGGAPKGKHPLVLVSAMKNPKAELSFAEFETSITEVFTADHVFGYRFLRTPLAFDEPRRRATLQCQDDTIGAYSVAFLGRDDMILVGGLCDRRGYTDQLPTFRALADSFRFDDPNAPPAPPPPPSLLDKVFGSVGPAGRTAAVGGAVAVVVLGLGAVLSRGGRPDRRRRDFY